MARYFLMLLLLLPYALAAQFVEGVVVDADKKPLVGASVYWAGTTIGVSTNSKGQFKISSKGIQEKELVVSFVGFVSDTIQVFGTKFIKVQLRESKTLDEIKVMEKRDGIIISSMKPIKTEQITSVELTKAACCDLAGCFNTQASVEPTTTNVVTNAKELRILGLSGVYNQILVDGMPMIQGLSYTYGVSTIPGTLADNIYVAKGANSVLQGYESISGQINVQLKDPDKAEKILVNAYMNSYTEKQVNLNYKHKFNKWRSTVAFHTTQPSKKVDKDKDTFLDLPLLTRYSIYNKWKYGNKNEWGWHLLIGLRYVNEQRIGGQKDFSIASDQGSTTQYGQTVNFSQPEFYLKTGYRFNNKHHFVLLASGFLHQQEAYFGTTFYDANQENAYLNFQHEFTYKDKHSLKTGISFRLNDISEEILFFENTLNRGFDGLYKKNEKVSGVFAENTFSWYDNTVQLITGIRIDHHNEFGTFVTPRSLLKWSFTENSTLRISAGTGWRTINLFSENVNLLASSRDIIITEELKPEEAVNYGINFIQKLQKNQFETQISIDFYRTQFTNQIFPDFDTNPSIAYLSNFNGKSISNGFQTEIGFEFFERVGTKVAYNYLDVFRKVNNQKYVLPFNPTHRIKSTFSFKPLHNKWHFDLNYHWYGIQQLPKTSENSDDFSVENISDPYSLVNCQFTKNWNNFDFYVGCENIFDFRQDQPIVGWEDPFGPDFDTSSVWGLPEEEKFILGSGLKCNILSKLVIVILSIFQV